MLAAAFAVLVLVPAAAAAQEKSYPAEVRAVLAEARKACTDEEGKRVRFAPQAVRKLDLTGDGRADFIVDLNHAKCDDRDTTFCGTGGCDFTILVAKPDGGFTQVFSQRVLAYRIEGTSGACTVRFDLHGSRCGKVGADECVKRQRISDRPFKFDEP
jgi:hypothetical protein